MEIEKSETEPIRKPPIFGFGNELGLLLNGGKSFALKSVNKKVKLADINIEISNDKWKKTPTVRMKEIDDYHMYKPLAEEVDLFKIPNSSERLDLHLLSDILILCGGFCGARFSSEV